MYHPIPHPTAKPVEPDEKKRRLMVLAKAMNAHSRKPFGGGLKAVDLTGLKAASVKGT